MPSHRDFNQELVRRYLIWMVAQHYAPGTQKFYRRVLKDFCAFVEEKLFTEVTHHDVVAFLAKESARGITLQGAHHQLNVLRVFYDFLSLGGMVNFVPPRFVRLRSVVRQLPRVLTEEQVRRLIAAAQSPRDKALIELLYSTGCRIGEISGIRLENIDFESKTIRVQGKGKTRIVLFGPTAKRVILAYAGTRRSGFLFTCDWPRQWGSVFRTGGKWIGRWVDYHPGTPRGKYRQCSLGPAFWVSYREARARLRKILRHEHLLRPERDRPLSPQTLLEALQRAALRARLGAVTARMLRHSFATHMLDHGADIRVIQELLGHAWVQTTQIYTHVSRAKLTATFKSCHPHGRLASA